ncbi:helix-turn-helix domain-containing protein [Anthocerotibacter panamensis]|uniref:helix-turn-helix domain-containing protein n=1 Tax=Anthocerotibacter panamensis TaxID=2857077 RepID=UPI001C405762|nr:helix-turn-helix domain-containing protein [Anthocerotibacter panamensis]
MATTLDSKINQLPPERQAAVTAKAVALIEEELTLRQLRQARRLTQERMAETLGIGQDSISRIEQRSDLLLSTLRSYVKAMGGDLQLIVEFPDRPAVRLASLAVLGNALTPNQDAKARRSRTKVEPSGA